MKIREFKSFNEFENSNVAGTYNQIVIIRENGWVKCDLMTKCKSYKTVLKRFFDNLKIDNKDNINAWYETMLELCENGIFKENGELYGVSNNEFGYVWGIEEIDDGTWYIFFNILDTLLSNNENEKNRLADICCNFDIINVCKCFC